MTYKIWLRKPGQKKTLLRRPEIKVGNLEVAYRIHDALRRAGYLVFMAWDR